MKSNRQRRKEITAHRAEKRTEQMNADQEHQKASRIAIAARNQGLKIKELATVSKKLHVNKANLAPNASWGWPEFFHRGYYLDHPFVCDGCHIQQVWTASQQKWWYESAKGNVWTVAKYCRSCRRQERDRKNEARRVHLEGVERKKSHSG